MELDNLIFDRTQSDVSRVQSLTQKMIAGTATEAEKAEWLGGMKGAWNASDLNRIETWTVYLYDVLLQYGYVATITPKQGNWIESDIPYRSEIDRIRANVDALQTGFQSLADWREIVYNNTMDFTQANALEWDLQRIYDWLQAMASGFLAKQANTLFMVAGGVFNN